MLKDSEVIQEISGRSLEECKKKLFSLYGNDYEMKSKRTEFRAGGFLNLSQREYTVVTYTIGHKKSYQSNENAYTTMQYNESKQNEYDEFEKNRKAIIQQNNDKLITSQINQIAQMSEKLDLLTQQLSSVNTKVDMNSKVETHESITRIGELLSENEFTYDYIKMIENKIQNTFTLDQLNDFKLVQRYVVDWIGESITISKEKVFRPPHVVIVIGPTGVGKTTTIAKLASNTLLESQKNDLPKPEICILTIDTMRVGAHEQLAKFGEILGKNVQKAETIDDVKQIYQEYKEHVDYIFIDTSGYSPNDAIHIGNMKNLLDVKMNPDVYLAISASTKASDLKNVLRNYEPLAYESIIITKMDETQRIGNIISVLWEKNKSISYITDGQHVPKNIQKANVIEMLKNLSGFEIDRIHIEDKFGE